jgi:hypothetical protein
MKSRREIERVLGITGWHDKPLKTLVGAVMAAELAALTKFGEIGGFMGQLRTVKAGSWT